MTSRWFPLAILLLYAWFFPWLPGLRSPNELSRLYQARAIVDDHSLAVNEQLARHGAVGDLSVKGGRYYPNKAPGMSLLGAAVYAATKRLPLPSLDDEASSIFWLRLFLCAVPGAAAAELLRRILARHFEPALAAAGAAAFAAGTIMWPYSVLLMSHGPTAAALVGSWWCIERRRPAAAGLLAAVAVLLEYTSAIALPGLLWYAVGWRDISLSPASRERRGEGSPWRGAARLGLGAAPPLLLLALYHQLTFGSPFATGYGYLVNPAFVQFHARGFMGVGVPSLRALLGSFLDPARGLFMWAPFLALGVPGLWLLARRPPAPATTGARGGRALAALCASELAAYALFTASFTYEAWGWSVGPRHVTPLCAFLAPPALAAAEWLRERGLGFLPAALALAGVAKIAVTVAVCPYLPEELTNPVFQLVLPLARAGLRSPTLPEVLGAARGGVAVLAWFALLAAVALSACTALAARPGPSRPVPIAAAWLTALALSAAAASVPARDRFQETRAFMAREFTR